jgi:hypothetical protein
MLESAKDTGSPGIYKQAVADLLPAAKEYYEDAKKNLPAFTEHVVSEVITSVSAGGLAGALLPSKGMAGVLVSAGFGAAMAWDAYKGLKTAHDESLKPGADQEKIAHDLAAKTVGGTVDFAINMGGGWAGTEGGWRLSRTENPVGSFAQASQRGVMKVENETMLGTAQAARKAVFLTRSAFTGAGDDAVASVGNQLRKVVASPLSPISLSSAEGSVASRSVISARAIEPEQLGLLSRITGTVSRRTEQYAAVKAKTATLGLTSAEPAFQTYRATFHGHTKFDDGMGTAEENFANAKAGGLDISFLTPHNHDGARQGVAPDDPRTAAEAGVPILAQTPAEYGAIIDAANAASVPGKFYAGYGVEAGTIGPSGHSHGDVEGPGADGGTTSGTTGGTGTSGDHGGDHGSDGHDGNQGKTEGNDGTQPVSTAVLDRPPVPADPHATPGDNAEAGHEHDHDHDHDPASPDHGAVPFDPLEAARQTHHGGVNHINIFGIDKSLIVADRQPHPVASALKWLGVTMPDVQHYPDGDYASLGTILGKTQDVTGQAPIVQLNHPRFNTNSATDYGVTSFANTQEWLNQFVQPYVKLQEVVKGEALNATPVIETMKPGDFDPNSFVGYLDMGVQAGPTYGRDSHFGDPGGRPAGTGVLASSLDQTGVFDAMRNRRTFATTNYENLQGVLTANNGSVYMGTVLDQAAVPTLNMSVKVGGTIEPDANYEIKLMADEQIGDGKLAAPAKTVTMTGADLLKANQQVTFDPITHKLGNNSAYYVAIDRTTPGSTTTDHLLTAPIWVQPLSGAKHGLLARTLIGNGAQVVASPLIPAFTPQ